MTDDTMPLPTKPQPADVLVACETLMRAGFAIEAMSVLMVAVKDKEELHEWRQRIADQPIRRISQ